MGNLTVMMLRSIRRCLPATAGTLDFSGAAEADGDFAAFDDDGHVTAALGQLQHLLKSLVVFEHIDVLERDFTAGKGLPGARSVRSKIFSKDKNFFVHFFLVSKIGARSLNCK